MKKYFNLIQINPFTYLILILTLITGLFKYTLIIIIIVLFHELGHIIIATIFKRKITRIELLPFGGLIKMDTNLSSNICEDLLINVGGIFFQLILFLIFETLYYINLLNDDFFELLNYYNVLIITFNLIPICPLDGYKILKNIEELLIPYKKSFYISILISILTIGYLIINSRLNGNLIVIMFLFNSLLSEIKNIKYYMNRFYLERSLYTFNFDKIIYIDKKDKMYKNRTNYINGIHEKEYLNKRPLFFY